MVINPPYSLTISCKSIHNQLGLYSSTTSSCSRPALVSLFGISHENAFGVSSKHFLDQVTKFLNILGSNSLSQQFIEGKRELFGNYEYVAFRFLDPLEMDDISDLWLGLEGSSIIRVCIVFQRISASEAAQYAVEGRGIAESSSFDWSDVIGLLPGSRVRSDKPNKFLDIGIIDCTEN
ncbi:hypothetical protein CPB86DRAFT_305572 [Serendipita vermifera]|nr:hypothetical protein CPB86DRAFT_305572 [Serendipita vermifera]